MLDNIQIAALPKRGISKETCALYQMYLAKDKGQAVQAAKYPNGSYKLRSIDKKFWWSGDPDTASLYGLHLVTPKTKVVVICEGEVDTLSAAESGCMGVPLGVSGADAFAKAIGCVDWTQFDKVILAFDQDKAGVQGVSKAVDALPPTVKVYVPSPFPAGCKDINDVLLKHGKERLCKLLDNHKPYIPEGIVDISQIDFAAIGVKTPGIPTGFKGVDAKLGGIRRGETVLFTAGSGVGKSTLAHEIAYNLMTNHNMKVGYLCLEEQLDKSVKRMLSLADSRSLIDIGKEGFKAGDVEKLNKMVASGYANCVYLKPYLNLGTTEIVIKMRYMIERLKCEVILLDHVSIVLSGQNTGATGDVKVLDLFMTAIASLGKETNAIILPICHLKQPSEGTPHEEGRRVSMNDLRGSGALKQLPDSIIALERNTQGEYPNMCFVRCLKARETGFTGFCEVLEYKPELGRMVATTWDSTQFDQLSRGKEIKDKQPYRKPPGRTF